MPEVDNDLLIFWTAPGCAVFNASTCAGAFGYSKHWLAGREKAGEGPPLIRVARKKLYRKDQFVAWFSRLAKRNDAAESRAVYRLNARQNSLTGKSIAMGGA